jgi:hypothetical protein
MVGAGTSVPKVGPIPLPASTLVTSPGREPLRTAKALRRELVADVMAEARAAAAEAWREVAV